MSRSMKKKIVFLPYDFDTAIGINNEGSLVFSYNLEDTDQTAGGADIFNGQQSVLWKNLREMFPDELKSMYQTLRSRGVLSYARVEGAFEDHQAKWPEAIFNEDAWFKYLAPLEEKGSAAYLAMLQGTKAEQRKWWLYKPLVCMMTQSTCYKGTRKFTPKGVLWHSTGANNPWLKRYVQPDDNAKDKAEWLEMLGKNRNGNDWNHQTVQAGLNFWIGKLGDGTVAAVQTMPFDYRPWGCGSGSKGSCNNTHIQFEICEDALNDKAYFDACYKVLQVLKEKAKRAKQLLEGQDEIPVADGIEEEIQSWKRKQMDAFVDMSTGKITQDEFIGIRDEVREKVAELEHKRSEIAGKNGYRIDLEYALKPLAKAERESEMTRELLERLVERIYVYEDRVEVVTKAEQYLG